LKLVEFLYFYLMPETASSRTSASATNTAVLGGRGRELVAAFDRRRETVNGNEAMRPGGNTKSIEEKQNMLGKYLSNVQDLVEDLSEGGGLFSGKGR
jgi:Cell division control protein 14, SIN component